MSLAVPTQVHHPSAFHTQVGRRGEQTGSVSPDKRSGQGEIKAQCFKGLPVF